MTAIVDIIGREILDSRGNPTVEVSGGRRLEGPRRALALHRRHEAVELRDAPGRYLGKGVRKAPDMINGDFRRSAAWTRRPRQDRQDHDQLDSTPTGAGANAVLGVRSRWRKRAAAMRCRSIAMWEAWRRGSCGSI